MTTPLPIKVNREGLSEVVITRVQQEGRPVRLSDMFMKLWCGKHQPTEELSGWLTDRGFEIVPGGDHHGGWDVRMIQKVHEFELR